MSAAPTATEGVGAGGARAASPRGVTALMYACQQGDVERVRRILRAQPETIAKLDRSGKSALHYCCTSENKYAAQAADLLAMAAPDLVESRDEDGFTPLHLAVIAGNMPLVTFLLANNADINAVDSEKHTVVHWATVCGETGALRAVLAAGAPVSTPDVHGGYPLHYGAQMCGGDKDSSLGLHVLQTLLQHQEIKVDVEDGDGRQPLLWAASAGSAKAVLALIRSGATVNAPDKDGLTALHCAASRGHTDCIDTLLTLCGMSSDVIDSNGCTALHYSVTLGHADATALLLTHGADPNRQDRKGRSPAHCGCAKGQFETVKMIGAQGANLWLKNARGDLPLHEAAASGRRELVKWLLEARPSQVNARNNDGRCPLHLAALNDNSDMCKILLDAGAQVNPILRTSKNTFMTPLDCALQRGFRSTAKYLQLHGGVPASRLSSSKTTLPNGTSNLHIREEVTFGETTDSEREGEEKDERVKKKHRKKLTYKYERKKTISSGKDEDDGNVKASSSGEKKRDKNEKGEVKSESEKEQKSKENITYNSEVKITNNYGGINIERNGEIIISDGSPIPLKTEPGKTSTKATTDKEINLPDIAREPSKVKLTESTKITLPEISKEPVLVQDTNNNKMKTEEKSTETPSKIANISENIEEIKSLANTIEQTAKSITEEVAHIQQNLEMDEATKVKQPDQISYTSLEESEHKELIVEAAVHPPPKSSQTQEEEIKKVEEQIIQEPSISNTEEVGAGKESKIQEKDGKPATKESQIAVDKEITEEIIQREESELNKENDAIAEDQESHIEERFADQVVEKKIETPEEIPAEIIKDFEAASSIPKVVPTSKETENSAEEEETEKSAEEEETEKNAEEEETTGDVEESKIAVEVDESKIIVEDGSVMKEDVSDISVSTPDTVKLAEKSSIQEEDGLEPISESNVPEETEQTQIDEAEDTEPSKDDAIPTDAPEDDTKEDAETLLQEIEKEISEAVDAEGVTAVNVESKGTTVGKRKKFLKDKRQRAVKETPKIIPKQEKTPIDSTRDKKILSTKRVKSKRDVKVTPTEGKGVSKDREKVSKKAIEKVLEVTNGEKPERKPTKRLKEDRKIKTKTRISRRSSEEPTTDEEISTSSESDKRRKHKSFTILDEIKTSEKEKLKSKIPTPVFNLRKDFSKSDRHLDRRDVDGVDSRISLPNLLNENERIYERNKIISAYSDHERSPSDIDDGTRSASRRRRLRKKMKRDSRSAGSDYESSNLIDSGFEPSPRTTKIPRWKNMSERGVNMTSVTQTIQSNIRRYHLERKIFQHLLDLKRLQIRSGQHNESVLVKRAIDEYHSSCASTVGAGRYIPEDYSFKSFEKFLYHALRKLQKGDSDHLRGLPEPALQNPLLCTQSTHRCLHATHAYTGIPCAAYLPQMDHHTIPKIGYPCKPQGFLPHIHPKKTVTLELLHGNDKQVISLPTDRLDQNKRYYVTFTVKGQEPKSPSKGVSDRDDAHRHAKSV